MTASSANNVIRFEDCCRNKKAVYRPGVKSAAGDPLRSEAQSNQERLVHGLRAGAEFDDQLFAFEKIARHQCTKIADSMVFIRPSRRLDQILDHHILPTLQRIGFDEPISGVVFRIASNAWKLMCPLNEKIFAFHPMVNQQVEEVRRGIELKTRNEGNMHPRALKSLPQRIAGTIKEAARPENIFDLLDEITTPWIILPRAFHDLRKSQSCYLPAYLNTIERETRESCLSLFSRIVAEFVGNYSLKFADRHHRPEQIAKLLFYAYSALFWKTLRCPPENLTNSAVFDTFFNWVAMLAGKSDFLGNDERAAFNDMRRMIEVIFPARTPGSRRIFYKPEILRFMVTLRHGSLGTASVLRYFGVDQFLETRQTGSRFACPSVQSEVLHLLHAIQSKHHLESKQTREYMKLFIGCLKSAYALIRPDLPETAKIFLERIFYNLKIVTNI